MIISRKDWHYRFMIKYGSDELKYNLMKGSKTYTTCTYIRALLGVMLSVMAFLIGVAFVICFVLYMLVGMGWFAYLFATATIPVEPTLLSVAGLVGWIISIFSGAVWLVVKGCALFTDFLCRKSSERRTKKWLKKQEGAKESVFKKALKDRKDGICTIVKFEN